MRHGTPMHPTRSGGGAGPAHGAARSAAHRARTTPGLHRLPEPTPLSTADTTYLRPSRARLESGRRSRAASAPRRRSREAPVLGRPGWLDGVASRRTEAVGSHGRRARTDGPQHGRPTPTLRRARPQPPRLVLPGPRTAQLLTKGLAMLIVLGVTGLIGFFIVADARRGRSAEASTTDQAALAAGALGSRATDPAPLTLPEVFPGPTEVRASPAGPAYRLTMTHIDTECAIATVGTLGKLLQDDGCTQVVRAAMTAPYGDYLVTAGLFNLADAAGATALDDQLRHLVETGDGGFAAMATGEPGTDPATPPPSQVGWRSRGHYLLYCVITRPDGRLTAAGDPNAARITADLVDDYLAVSVLGRRAGT